MPTAMAFSGMSLVTTEPAPDVVTYRDVDAVLVSGISRIRVQRVTRGVKADVGRDLHVVADPDLAHVKHHEIKVGKEVVPDLNVVTVVAAERLLYIKVAASDLTEDLLFKELQRLFLLIGRHVIEFIYLLSALESVLGKPVHPGLVRKIRRHSFAHVHVNYLL